MPAHLTTRRGLRHQAQAADAAVRLAAIARSSGSPSSSGSSGWVPPEPAPAATIGDADESRDLLLDLRDNRFQEGDSDDDTHHRRRARHGARPQGEDLDGWRQRALDRLPVTIRESRWAVPLTAVAALLAVVGLVGTVVAVRTAAATPGIPVPARQAASGQSTDPAVSTGARTGAAGAATSPAPVESAAGPAGELVIHVVGQVRKPGVVRLPVGSRVNDAVAAAGGALDGADLTRVNLARVLGDGEQLFVPRPGEEMPVQPGGPAAAGGPGEQGGPAGRATGAVEAGGGGSLLDINTATPEQLQELPGVGPVLAGRILEWREQNGTFSSVDELGEVSGIGPKVLERLRPLVTV